MLHQDVVDVSTRVPPDLKMQGTDLRTFYKRAMADFLPSEIINKSKHGFGLPFGYGCSSRRAWRSRSTAISPACARAASSAPTSSIGCARCTARRRALLRRAHVHVVDAGAVVPGPRIAP
jgi:hypothetical protein